LLLGQQCASSALSPTELPIELRYLHSYPFVIDAKKVIVSRGGMLALRCGPFGLFASCEAVKWGVPLADSLVHTAEKCYEDENHRECQHLDKHDKVFVMTQYDDTQIGIYLSNYLIIINMSF
jgi:hypothetical protein